MDQRAHQTAGAGSDLPDTLVRGLRAAVLAHKQAAPRGRLAPVLHAGQPGGAVPARFDPGADRFDHDLRVEVAVALGNLARREVESPVLWLARSGDLEESSPDLAWQAAATAAWGELGLEPSFVLLTRHGWRHHPSGAHRRWRRLRARAS